MENEKSLASVLRTLRLERGMSLREFGDFLDISHAYLSKLEKGFDSRSGKEIAPTIEILIKISENLEIPVDEFLESCGYFKSDSAAAEDRTSHVTVDLKVLTEEMIRIIQDAGNLTYDGCALTKADGKRIADAIELGVELARRRL